MTLTSEEIEQYRSTGYMPARPVLTADEVSHCRRQLELFEASQGATLGELPGQLRAKTHLLFTWLDELIRHPGILDVVEDLIGPDILVYHVTSWLKEPGSGSYVSWHQDGTYFGLTPPEHVTAWVALSEADETSGCMRIIPGSHRDGQLEHAVGPTEDNLLSNGQVLRVPFGDEDAILLPVPSGSMSLHHTYLVHASGPNHGPDRRIGIGISYIPTHVSHLSPIRQTAMLVRGTNRYGHFDPEVPPKADFDAAAQAFHAQSCERFFEAHGSKRTEGED